MVIAVLMSYLLVSVVRLKSIPWCRILKSSTHPFVFTDWIKAANLVKEKRLFCAFKNGSLLNVVVGVGAAVLSGKLPGGVASAGFKIWNMSMRWYFWSGFPVARLSVEFK